jgi:hypothetical protein
MNVSSNADGTDSFRCGDPITKDAKSRLGNKKKEVLSTVVYLNY